MFNKENENKEESLKDGNNDIQIKPVVQQQNNEFMHNQFNQQKPAKNVKQGEIPPFITKEVKLFVLANTITLIISLGVLIYLSVSYTIPAMEEESIMLVLPLGLVTVFLGYKIITSTLGLFEIRSDQKIVEAESRQGITSVPLFLLKGYRKLKVRITNMNWLAFTSYIVLGLVVFVHSMAVEQEWYVEIPLLGWTIFNHEILENSKTWTDTITLFKVSLIVILSLHVAILISTRSRLHRIDIFYGYEIISNQEVGQLKDRANKRNRRILFISILIIFLIIWVPYKLIKERKK